MKKKAKKKSRLPRCPWCREVGTIYVSPDDPGALFCSGCDFPFRVKDVRQLIRAARSVLAAVAS